MDLLLRIIYQKIGQLLVNAGPSNAARIVVRAEIFPEDDGGKYEFDYLDETGDLDWFDPDGRAVSELTDLLVQLKYYFKSEGLTQRASGWTNAVITLDVKEMKISIEFDYGTD